jgi:hypothetical protein
MSPRWKVAIAVLLLIPILAFATGTAVIYRMLGRYYASRFVIGTVMGTRARPLTKRQFDRTPNWETGAGSWTDDMLARAIREGVSHDGRALIPIMPYESFMYISDEDIGCIVVYLRSIPPVHHALPKMKLPLLLKLTAAGFPQPLRSSVVPPMPLIRQNSENI